VAQGQRRVLAQVLSSAEESLHSGLTEQLRVYLSHDQRWRACLLVQPLADYSALCLDF
jgi:hypothetical protein